VWRGACFFSKTLTKGWFIPEKFSGGKVMANPLENNSPLENFFTAWSAPNRATALQQYGSRAPIYDLQLGLAEPLRQQAIDRLGSTRVKL
jgi:hypothetical protein